MNQVESTLRDLGFEIHPVLVRDDFDGRKGDSHWSVTIVRNGQSMQLEYSQGCAHRHFGQGKHKRPIQLNPYRHNQRSKPNVPTLADVMYCIVLDAQSIACGQTFEEFAADFGYDEDSKSAERIYNGCRDEFFGLQRLGVDLDELSELFQDY